MHSQALLFLTKFAVVRLLQGLSYEKGKCFCVWFCVALCVRLGLRTGVT